MRDLVSRFSLVKPTFLLFRFHAKNQGVNHLETTWEHTAIASLNLHLVLKKDALMNLKSLVQQGGYL
jgi:hypothetical protein